jgi:plastocyanin
MRTPPLMRTIVAATAVLTLAVGCGGSSKGSSGASGGGGKAAPAGDTITIKNFAYNALTVKPGATVTVVNADAAAHTLTSDDKKFDSGTLSQNQKATITAPSAPGDYTYYCTIHTYMKATLKVAG